MAGWMTDRLAHGDDKVASVCDCEPLAFYMEPCKYYFQKRT